MPIEGFTEEQTAEIVSQWKTEVYDKGAEVDPGDEFIWRGIIVGWAIGKGYVIDQAHDIADHIHFHTDFS